MEQTGQSGTKLPRDHDYVHYPVGGKSGLTRHGEQVKRGKEHSAFHLSLLSISVSEEGSYCVFPPFVAITTGDEGRKEQKRGIFLTRMRKLMILLAVIVIPQKRSSSPFLAQFAR